MSERISVRIPATSANLGCLFDSAALALSLYLELHVTRRGDNAVNVRYSGVNPERVPADATNLVATTIRETLESWGHPHGFDLEIQNEIPVGVGLGSSAAAIVGGLAAARWLADRALFDEELITLATRREGHPDNVAAAWLGGLTVAVQLRERVLAFSCPVPETLQLVLVVPSYALPTEKARKVLPPSYSRADAVHNLQRAVVVASQFFSGKTDLRHDFFEDRWHQPYRAPLVPGLSDVLSLQLSDLLGVCLSGAGPSILAFVPRGGNASAAGELIRQTLRRNGVEADARVLAADNQGAKG